MQSTFTIILYQGTPKITLLVVYLGGGGIFVFLSAYRHVANIHNNLAKLPINIMITKSRDGEGGCK